MADTQIKAVLTVEGLRQFQGDMAAASGAVEGSAKRSSAAGAAIGKAAKVGFAAAAVAAVASVKSYASFDDAMNRVKINSGATTSELKAMGKVAKKMGEQFPASATESAEAMNELLKAGMSVKDLLGGGLEQAMSMATAEGMNMAESATIMANNLAAFEIKGKDAAQVTAALSNVSSDTTAGVTDLATAMSYVAASAHGLGIDIGDTSAALGVLMQNGLDGSKAGTALRAMLAELADPASEASKAFKELGINTFDSKGKFRDFNTILGEFDRALDGKSMKEKAAIFQTFGKVGGNAAQIFSRASGAVRDLSKSADDFGRPVSKAKEQMKSMSMQIDTTKEAIGNMAMQIGSALAPAVLAVLPAIQNVAGAIGSIDASTMQTAAAFVALTGAFFALSPAAIAVGGALKTVALTVSMTTALSGTTGALGLLKGGFAAAALGARALTAALLTNPLFISAALAGTVIGLAAALRNIPKTGAEQALVQQKAASAQAKAGFDGLRAAVDGVISSQLALRGSSLGVERAKLSLAEAINRVNQLEDAGKRGTDEYKSALLSQKEAAYQVSVAQEQHAASADRVKKKQSDLAKTAREAYLGIRTSGIEYQTASQKLDAFSSVVVKAADGQKTTVGELAKTSSGLRFLANDSDMASGDVGTLAKTMLKAAKSMEDGKGKAKTVAGILKELGWKAGSASGDVAKLKVQLDNMPKSVSVKIDADTGAFGSALTSVQNSLNNLKASMPSGGSGGKSAKKGVHKASGGRVTGAGTGTSDSIPAWLSNGEWVLTARQAKAIGYHNLAQIPKFAGGGKVVAKKSAALTKATKQAKIDASPALKVTQATKQYNAALAAQKGKKGAKLTAARQLTAQRASDLVSARQSLAGAKADAKKAKADKDSEYKRQKRVDAVTNVSAAGSAIWKAQQLAGVTENPADDLAALQSKLAELKALGTEEAADDIAQTEADIWTMLNVTMPAYQKQQIQKAIAAVGSKGTDLWKKNSLAAATSSTADDLAALNERLTILKSYGDEAAQEVADTEADIWTMLNVTIPQQSIAAVGAKGSDLWKKASFAAATDTLDDDLAILQEQLTMLQGFGSLAADRIADTEADIWTMLNITMPEKAKAAQAQIDAMKADAAMAMSRGFYAATGGAGGGGNVGETDSTGGGASGVGHAPRPEIDRVWLDGVQVNDLTARANGAGVTITEILGWDEAEDLETQRSKRADGDAIGGQRDGGASLTIKGRVQGSSYANYHARRRALKAIIRRASGDTDVLLKVPDITLGTTAGDYPSAYAADNMQGMERRWVRLVGNVKWGDTFGTFGSEFEFELRAASRWVESDILVSTPSGASGAAASLSALTKKTIISITGDIPASPIMSGARFTGENQNSIIDVILSNSVSDDASDELVGSMSLTVPTVRSGAAQIPADTFARLSNPATLPAGIGYGVAFSTDGTYMAVAHPNSPYITIYKRSGDTFTKLSNPATLPVSAGRGVAFSTDGTYMAVTHLNSPYITIYKRSGDTFTKLSNPATLPTGSGYGVAFSTDGTYMSVAHDSSPYVTIYKRSGDTFTKLSNPATLPAGTGYGVAFSTDGTYMSVAHDGSPYVTIYRVFKDAIVSLGKTFPATSNDIDDTRTIKNQDTVTIDTVKQNAVLTARSTNSRLLLRPSLLLASIPASTGVDAPHNIAQIVSRNTGIVEAVTSIAQIERSPSNVINESAIGELTDAGTINTYSAALKIGTNLPAWRLKETGVNLTASSYARRQIGNVLGDSLVRPQLHVSIANPPDVWSTAESTLNGFGSTFEKHAHLLTLESTDTNAGGTTRVASVGYYSNSSVLVPVLALCHKRTTPAATAYSYRHFASLTDKPVLGTHVWVNVILDAGANIWLGMVSLDAATGAIQSYMLHGFPIFGGAGAGAGDSIQPIVASTSGTMSNTDTYTKASTRRIGVGTAANGSSVAGSLIPANGMSGIYTLDAMSELESYGVTRSGTSSGLSSRLAYAQVARALRQWIADTFTPQTTQGTPIAMSVDWRDQSPSDHAKSIIKLRSRVAPDYEQALGKSKTGGVSTEQMSSQPVNGVGDNPITIRRVR